MTIRIGTVELAMHVHPRRPRYLSAGFGRPAPDLAVIAAALISGTSVLMALGQIAGAL